ncbi:SWIM zinc finger family protein [Leptolyngbya sp. AN02str]|uniref:SWIM zinc finger family protein n=1 Tax=Leptolyngbya sp. AN02str TaxID=3423363 RepID=UPI003D31583C
MTNYDAQSGREWWAQRWVDVLESFGWVRRLARARNYAREGHVLSLEFRGAKVVARVQGTAPEPYRVSLSLDPFTDEQWQYVIESLSQRAIFSAKLLSGEMPTNIEQVFTNNGLSLFPFTKFDIHSKCSCPDQANPCKHIGAVYYVLGDRFSEDPFVLFQLRGRTKEQVIGELRRLRSAHTESQDAAATKAIAQDSGAIDLANFWRYDQQIDPSLVVIAPSTNTETVLDILGPMPLHSDVVGTASTLSPQMVMDYLRTIYGVANQAAVISAMTAGANSSSS